MDVSKLVAQASFAWLAKEYLEFEAKERNNPLLVHDKAFMFSKNEILAQLREEFPNRTDRLELMLKTAQPGEFYDMVLSFKNEWSESVEELIQGICFELPSSFENIKEVLHRQYNLVYGDWFDYLLTFTNVSSQQPADHDNFTVSPHNGMLWYITPKPGWKTSLGFGRKVKWEFVGKLKGHPWLNDKEAENLK